MVINSININKTISLVLVTPHILLLLHVLFTYIVPMEIHITRGDDWDHIKWFNPATFVCLPQVKTWISNVICHGLFVFSEQGSHTHTYITIISLIIAYQVDIEQIPKFHTIIS
jgi:hypothetical protein